MLGAWNTQTYKQIIIYASTKKIIDRIISFSSQFIIHSITKKKKVNFKCLKSLLEFKTGYRNDPLKNPVFYKLKIKYWILVLQFLYFFVFFKKLYCFYTKILKLTSSFFFIQTFFLKFKKNHLGNIVRFSIF